MRWYPESLSAWPPPPAGGEDVSGGVVVVCWSTVVVLPLGSFASAFRNTGSSSQGRLLVSQTDGTGALTCADASAVGLSAWNGRLPMSSSYATTASAYRSLAGVARSPCACS